MIPSSCCAFGIWNDTFLARTNGKISRYMIVIFCFCGAPRFSRRILSTTVENCAIVDEWKLTLNNFPFFISSKFTWNWNSLLEYRITESSELSERSERSSSYKFPDCARVRKMQISGASAASNLKWAKKWRDRVASAASKRKCNKNRKVGRHFCQVIGFDCAKIRKWTFEGAIVCCITQGPKILGSVFGLYVR